MSATQNTVEIIGDDDLCRLLLSRSIPEGMPVDFYDDVLESIRPYAFYGMAGLESVELPNVTTLGRQAFYQCPDLERVTLPLVQILPENCFSGCTNLAELDAPNVTQLESYCLLNCGIASVSFPNLTLLSFLGYIFSSCTSLVDVRLPKLSSLSSNTFYNCTSLTQIDLPSIVTIDSNAFKNASSLQVVNIGPKIRNIFSTAFSNTPEGLVINLPVAEGAISGAPWGATNAVINYETPYAGTVPIPES